MSSPDDALLRWLQRYSGDGEEQQCGREMRSSLGVSHATHALHPLHTRSRPLSSTTRVHEAALDKAAPSSRALFKSAEVTHFTEEGLESVVRPAPRVRARRYHRRLGHDDAAAHSRL